MVIEHMIYIRARKDYRCIPLWVQLLFGAQKDSFCSIWSERHARAIFCSSNVEIPRARRPWDFDIRAAKDSRGYPVMPYVAHLGQKAISRLMHDDQCFSLILRAI